jgi:hypothetical protein
MDQILGSSSEDHLPVPVAGGRSLTSDQRRQVDLSSTIPGWGSDLDPKRRPGVPRDKSPDLGVEWLYPPLERQVAGAKVHKSTEHGQLTPVFGTSCPPSGLSGRIRDVGYRFSEGRLSRWMTLMVADRVNVVEDVLADLGQGRFPNLAKEMGLKSEIRYNPAGFAKKVALVGLCVAACVAYSRARSRRAPEDAAVGSGRLVRRLGDRHQRM